LLIPFPVGVNHNNTVTVTITLIAVYLEGEKMDPQVMLVAFQVQTE